uniref:GS catalytic domain-containing protein n=1 Tax=Eutreptiella gymnastica TaxID=73025 RepID=A0A7S1NK75_9EUGL
MVHTHLYSGGVRWKIGPRGALIEALAQAERRHGLTLRLGFEHEFLLLRPNPNPSSDDKWVPIDQTSYCASQAWHQQVGVLDAIVNAVEALGQEVEQCHAEAAPGQFEIVTHHMPAMEAVDALVMCRETICAVAATHGLKATFIPKFFANEAGNGSHMHFSLWANGCNIFSEGVVESAGLPRTAAQFVAGVLHHLPALMAVTTPSTNSYRRLQPGTWSGAFQVWGMDNREAPLRGAFSPDGSTATNFELKAMDATANPYLAAAALIYAGLDGIDMARVLPEPVEMDPHLLESAPRLPTSPEEAYRCLQHSDHAIIRQGLGEGLVRAVLATGRSAASFFSERTFAEEVKILVERL